jgi:hypothetical protein
VGISAAFNSKKIFNFFRKIEKKDNDFLLILSDIGNNFAEFEYLFRNTKVIIESPF